MPINHITDHVDQGLSRILDQYKNKPRIQGWFTSYLLECQALEDAAWDVAILRLIDNAEGEQLDVIGRIVGELRLARDDTTYRKFITVRIRVNRSRGKAADVIAVLRLLEPTTPYEYYDVRTANILIVWKEAPVLSPYDMLQTFRDTKGAGIGFAEIAPTTDSGHEFECSNLGDVDDPAHGLGDVNAPTTDGLLSTIVM